MANASLRMPNKVEPKQLRASLIRNLERQYTRALVVSILLMAACYFLGWYNAKLFLFPFEAMLMITAFVGGGFLPLVRFARLEEYLQTLEPKEISQ
jgi:hypothetical protein